MVIGTGNAADKARLSSSWGKPKAKTWRDFAIRSENEENEI